MKKDEFKATKNVKGTNRLVAKSEFSQLTAESTAHAWELVGHRLLKVNFMHINVSSEDSPSTKHVIKNGLKTTDQRNALWRLRTNTVKKIIIPPVVAKYSAVEDLLEDVWKNVVSCLKETYGYIIDRIIPFNSMVTENMETGEICVWERQSFKDFDGDTVYRQVLRKIDGKDVDKIPPHQALVVVDELVEHVCHMKSETRFFCSYSSK